VDRAAAISPLRRGTAAKLAAEPVRLSRDRRRLPPGGVDLQRAEMVLSKPCCGLAFSGHSRSGQVESSPAAMATDSRPAEEIPRI
jgi:hypothetical protein